MNDSIVKIGDDKIKKILILWKNKKKRNPNRYQKVES